jgi:hypothetical protein
MTTYAMTTDEMTPDAKLAVAKLRAMLKGLTVTDYRPATKRELRFYGWDNDLCWGQIPFVLVFNNGQKLIASQDEEGNGPGEMFVFGKPHLSH